MEKQENQLQIDLPADVTEGVYANLAIIAHSTSEFVVDFVRLMPGVPKAKVKSRVVLTPEHAKRLMLALEDNVARYEKQFGQIRTDHSSPFGGLPPMFNNGGEA